MTDRDVRIINIRSAREIRKWARDFGATPEVVKIAVKRVGTSPELVQQYLSCPPSRWQPELYSKSPAHGRKPRVIQRMPN